MPEYCMHDHIISVGEVRGRGRWTEGVWDYFTKMTENQFQGKMLNINKNSLNQYGKMQA